MNSRQQRRVAGKRPGRLVFQIKLTPEDARRLAMLAKQAELTRAQLVRELLKKAEKEASA